MRGRARRSSSRSWYVPALIVVLIATALGMPIFAAMGGAALLLFWGDGTPVNAVPGEAYRLTTSPMLPAIPLFALGGYILAEGTASQRLMRLFTALVGWMPGGLAIVVTAVLAFFTPLTGASGVTILSMGGLLLPVLVGARYSERTSIGLVTVSGSIGLLFFPSLPVFLYSFYAGVPVDRLFVAALIPGIVLVAVVAGWAASTGWLARRHSDAVRVARGRGGACGRPSGNCSFQWSSSEASCWESPRWSKRPPMAVLYVVVIECAVHRGLSVTRDLPRVAVECATLLGGFLIILSVALGLTNYLVIAEVPVRLLDWAEASITSPIVFLLALNVFLILVGALMDIYSAIVVVVPLILPLARSATASIRFTSR